MSRVRWNLAANFAGGAWSAVISLAFVPLYIHFMGIEAYGLVGFMATLQAVSTLLDLGLSATLSREAARLSVEPGTRSRMRDLLRTLELPYWGMALLLAAAVVGLAPLVAGHWIQPGALGEPTVQRAVMLMGLALAMQWPCGLYAGGLQGLQRQVLLNGINAVAATVRAGGAVLVLWKVSPTVEAFFLWQFLVGPLQTLTMGVALWRSIPGEGPARFRSALLREVGGFAVGMSGISILGLVLTQMDKVLLSRILPLEQFGYYALAAAVASSLYRIIVPVFSALYPRFTQLVALGDEGALVRLYHQGCQFMSVLILPATVIAALFSTELLRVWTGNPVTAANTGLILALLVCGTALNGLMNLPYALQLAYGWTRLALLVNTVAVLLLAPLVVLLGSRYGGPGAAAVWVMLNVGYVVVDILLMHRRLLPGEQGRWYLVDVGLPLAAAFVVGVLGRLAVPAEGMSRPGALIAVLCVAGAVQACALWATPMTRGWLRERVSAMRTSPAA